MACARPQSKQEIAWFCGRDFEVLRGSDIEETNLGIIRRNRAVSIEVPFKIGNKGGVAS